MAFVSELIKELQHEAAHMTRERTEYCQRDMVADGWRGFYGQVEHMMANVLSPDDIAKVEVMLGEPWRYAGYSATADAIEDLGYFEWIDGDVYYLTPCGTDGDTCYPHVVLRDDNGEEFHIKVSYQWFGDEVLIIRDWNGDHIEYYGHSLFENDSRLTEWIDTYYATFIM